MDNSKLERDQDKTESLGTLSFETKARLKVSSFAVATMFWLQRPNWIYKALCMGIEQVSHVKHQKGNTLEQ